MDADTRRGIETACERLIHRFALLNDAHDHDALADLFVEDGSFARPSDPANAVTGRAAIRAFFAGRPKRRTRHVMANVVVDVCDAASARAKSYVVLYAGERGDQVMVGDFDDSFRRDADETWKFADRRGSLAFEG